ncbi:MAG: PIN domain-containing protein [bacterium]
MATTYLIDSNILVYAYDLDSHYHKKAKEIIDKKVLSGKINACVSHQVLYEFYAVITDSRRVGSPLESDKAREIIESCQKAVNLKKIFPLSNTLKTVINLLKKYSVSKQSVFDLVLVATMMDNNIKGIYTTNEAHFKQFEFLEVINPLKATKSRRK